MNNEKWDSVIEAKARIFDINLKEVWQYRDLLILFVRRDFVSQYKQTILGPIWYFLQPLLTTITFTVIFGNIAKISTEGVPQVAFYLSGITLWQYFSECLNTTASTFNANQNLFGKVYFPRVIVPLSVIVSGLIKFIIQFVLFAAVVLFYYGKGLILPNLFVLLTPLLVFILAFLSLSLGMIFSSLTTKYRDLVFLLTFGVQLFMYATPIIYPLSAIPLKYQSLYGFNPLTHIVEAFRYAYLGSGSINVSGLVYSGVFALAMFVIALLIFNRVEKNFMDTV